MKYNVLPSKYQQLPGSYSIPPLYYLYTLTERINYDAKHTIETAEYIK